MTDKKLSIHEVNKYLRNNFFPYLIRKKVPWDIGKERPMNKKIALKNLMDFKGVMEKYNLTFFLIFGTLLGAVRERNFIEEDFDIDLGLFFEDKIKFTFMLNDLEDLGFQAIFNGTSQHDNYLVRDGEKIDLWWFEEIRGERIYNPGRFAYIRYPKKFLEKLDEIEFKNKIFKIPNKVESFLEITYGKKWRKKEVDGF